MTDLRASAVPMQADPRGPAGEDPYSAVQFRICQIQILNWGAYAGLQTVAVARSGTAILGPSGRGKSTLLDAMASVILPNPQEFNQAARDDRRGKRERTVYSYARGHTDQRQDQNRRSATTNYLRPPGGPGFPSGAAITWATDDGRRVTSFRLVWVGPDADGPEAINAATVYGFVHDSFDLAQLHGINAVRQGASPLSKTSLERLVDVRRGDLVDPSQARVHAKMRTVMGMGATDESQRLAMQLLRRAQASKGIFSINALFKEFVLTEPLALARWDTALEAYREASRLYDEFETARRRTDTLKPLPDLAEKYRSAGADYSAKHRMLFSDGDSPSRIEVWHAGQVVEWAAVAVEDNRLAKAQVDEDYASAARKADAANQREQNTIDRITAAGGDRSEAIVAKLDSERKTLNRLNEERDRFTNRLSVFGLGLPTSSGDVTLTHTSLEQVSTRDTEGLKDATEAATQASGRLWKLRNDVKEKERELTRVRERRSLIPEDADTRRNRIAADLGLDTDRIRYAGELLQVKTEHSRWEAAVVGLLLPLSSTLLVDSRDFGRVRRYVHDHDMQGTITITSADSGAPGRPPTAGGVPMLLDIADHTFSGWLANELNETVNYLCVETEAELDTRTPTWARGCITPAGMRTGARGRFTKDDRRLRYPWLGWDTRRLLKELADELESLKRELQSAGSAADEAGRLRDSVRDRLSELGALHRELTWDKIDATASLDRIVELERELAEASSPHVTDLKKLLKEQREKTIEATREARRLEDEQKRLDRENGELAAASDDAKRRLKTAPPLTDEEHTALMFTRFDKPADPKGVAASLVAAVEDLRRQIERHKDDREKHEATIVAHISAYRNLDERTARETDGTIDSLPALLAVYRQLVTDDLPRAKGAWLAKVDDDMNRQLRGVLVQIDEDARTIKRGLEPINDVLRHVRFRQDATLSIEPVERPSSDLKEFRQIISKYTSNTVGLNAEREADQIEKSFTRLRKHLAKLDDQSRAGDSWRRRVFDAREHVEFQAIETRPDGVKVIHDGVSGMSGGEGQELIAFILGAALRFRLGEGHEGPPSYASIILDEGFVKADSDYTGRALSALSALGFQLIVGAPREKATAFEDHVESVAYINVDVDDRTRVRIYPMTMTEALRLEEDD
jgi:uncharacterized protein YPO0396